MKKYLALVMTAIVLMTSMFIFVEASSVFDPVAADDCASGLAHIEVNFMHAAPVMDGKVDEGEYYEIPYSAVKDYYSFYIGASANGDHNDIHDALLSYVENDMKVYATWDGTYMYFAVTGKAPADQYTCPERADSVYMYQYWCLQLGLAEADAVGTDRYEIGIGASSDNLGQTYYHATWGPKTLKNFNVGESCAANWDREAETVTYEARINIAEVSGKAPANNSQMRFLYLFNQSGQVTANGNDAVQIQSSYGCAAAKAADQYLLTTFVGMPDDIEVTTAPADTSEVEEELEGYWGKIDFRDYNIIDKLNINNNVTAEFKAEDNGDSYVRFTATGENPYIGGKKLPDGCNADACKFIAIHYRTSSKKSDWIGFNYMSSSITELGEDILYENDSEMGTDGEWHTTVVDMTGAEGWTQFITNFCFYLFADQSEVTGETIDIMWMKYYDTLPAFDDEYYPDYSDDTTTAPIAATTDAPAADTTDNPSDGTNAPSTNAPSTSADPGDNTKDGFPLWAIIVIAVGVVAVVVVVIVVVKKKK